MKQRFSSLDVKVIAHELSSTLVGLRVHNIYDLSSRIFLFKFHAPEKREQVLIDSGFRCHLTSFVRSTAAAPSVYVSRLRKSLKTRRVTSISQVGTDRIIEFQFSDGLYRLYLEFYAGGNIVLTDKDLNILSALRKVDDGPEHEHVIVGATYNLDKRQNYGGAPPLTLDRLRTGLEQAVERQKVAGENAATTKKSKKRGNDSLRRALAVAINELPPILLENAFHVKGFDSAVTPEDVLADQQKLDDLFAALQEAEQVVTEITSSSPAKGYIMAKQQAKKETTDDSAETPGDSKPRILYDDYHPFRPAQFEKDPALEILEFEGFNKTVDEFYSSLEGQKLESRLVEREEAAKKKLQSARDDHAKRIGGLQQVQELNIRKAEAITANVERVEEAIGAVNGLIAQAMDWVDIARLIEQEQSRGNPVAQLIKLPLKLFENTVTLQLGEAEQDEDFDSGYVGSDTESSDSEDDDAAKPSTNKKPSEMLSIDIDLALSPWANASQYYDQKKTAAVKEEKTMQASTKALQSTEKKITADLKKGLKQEKDILRPVRKQFWFEKFLYFISSDGYLVLGGKDAQQNEMLYRRYLRKGDIYVHADLHGASTVIVKNNPSTPDAPIPPSTLSQAGNLSVCASGAWDSKAVMSAWWVEADQVSKSAPTGEYLQTGSFMIRGKKNFLPPSQLLMGFAIVWQISDDSKFRHTRHRMISEAPAASTEDGEPPAVSAEELPQDKPEDEQEDSDEDFPDAKVNDDDSDEDFPDSKPVDATDSEGEDRQTRANPLQSAASKNYRSDANDTAEETEVTANEDSDDDAEHMMSGGIGAQETSAQTSEAPTRKHLSAHQRRMLKKGKAPPTGFKPDEEAGQADEEADADDTVGSAAETEANGKSTESKPRNKPLPRGKRSKAKKAALKYADQDEEDRQLAMRILGSSTGQEAAAAAAAEKKVKDEEDRLAKERRKNQHLKKLVAEEKQRSEGLEPGKEPLDVEDEGEDDESSRKNELDMLDSLVGKLLPGDEALSAVMICAPWTALATYKYKIKLQPGSTKKGKAVREMLARWQMAAKMPRALDQKSQDVEKIWPREADLILGLKDAEAIGNLPMRTLRVVMSGGAGGDGGPKKGGSKSARGGRGSKRK